MARPSVADPGEIETLARMLRPWLAPTRDPAVDACRLLAEFGCIGRVVGACEGDLIRIVGSEAAAGLVGLHQLVVRSLAFPLRTRTLLGASSAVSDYLRAQLTARPREAFHVLFLDQGNRLIADERMGDGTVNHAPAYPREVMRRALELSASALCLAHNHPSGDACPSSADIEMTQRIVQAGKALAIAVHDHWLVAGRQVVSFRALGLM